MKTEEIKVCHRCEEPRPLSLMQCRVRKNIRANGEVYFTTNYTYCKKCHSKITMNNSKNNTKCKNKRLEYTRKWWKKHGKEYRAKRKNRV